jgi:uncharacterized protein YecT (DUF1311 family)
MKTGIFGLIFALSAPLAEAQTLAFSIAPTESCLASGGDAAACAGAAADACMHATEGGFSTAAMSGCLDRELQWWDDRLNASYGFAMEDATRRDAEDDGFGPSREAALRAMQRAWIPYRDRRCDYIRSQWGGGTGGGPAALDCLLRETARQTWFIESVVAPG